MLPSLLVPQQLLERKSKVTMKGKSPSSSVSTTVMMMPRSLEKQRPRRAARITTSDDALTKSRQKFLLRITKLNCGAASNKMVAETDEKSWSSTLVAFDSLEQEFDVQEQLLPIMTRRSNKKKMPTRVAPCLSAVMEDADENNEDDEKEDDVSDAFFTDDETSNASSGLQVNTMDADSCDSIGEYSGDEHDDVEDNDLVSVGEHRIGIRPFVLPQLEATFSDASHSSNLSPPILSESSSTDNDTTIEMKDWGRVNSVVQNLHNVAIAELESNQVLSRDQRELVNLNCCPDVSLLLEQDAVEPASPSPTMRYMLVEPPKLERRLETAYKAFRCTHHDDKEAAIRRKTLHHMRWHNSDDTVDDQRVLQLPLLFHASETRPSHNFRSSSPGIDPARTQPHYSKRDLFRSIDTCDEEDKVKRVRSVSTPGTWQNPANAILLNRSVLGRAQALNNGTRIPRVSSNARTSTIPPPVACKSSKNYSMSAPRPRESTNMSDLHRHSMTIGDCISRRQNKVRWSSDISSTIDHTPLPPARAVSHVRSIYCSKDLDPETSDTKPVTAQHQKKTISNSRERLIYPFDHPEARQPTSSSLSSMSWNSCSRDSIHCPANDYQEALEPRTSRGDHAIKQLKATSASDVGSSLVSEHTNISFSSIKDLIDKFDSNGASQSKPWRHSQHWNTIGSEEGTTMYVDVLSRHSSKINVRASKLASSNEATISGLSGFYWRSHPSVAQRSVGGTPYREEPTD
ncbi:hypothetical protein MPSEU_000576900 [Mayamaea pseudoterrestris]|nr:hypothetical protein MPSEU_000576900 [Mayamaea pseudoterrestris]